MSQELMKCVLCGEKVTPECPNKRHCKKHHELYKDITN